MTAPTDTIKHFASDNYAGICPEAQLASTMRFISAPWLGLFDNDVRLRNARHDRLAGIPGVSLMFKPDSNAVFAELPAQAAATLRAKGWRFYQFIASGGCRLMCAWGTKQETVERFADEVRALCATH